VRSRNLSFEVVSALTRRLLCQSIFEQTIHPAG